MSIITFQKCQLEDLPVLLHISKNTFHRSYSHLNTLENMTDYISKAFNSEQLQKELMHPDSSFYFLKKGKEIIGYFKINENEAQTEFQTKDSLEVERIYILEAYQRKGYGRKMLNKTLDIAQEKSKTRVWLGVWENNPKAISFYKSLGFKHIGKHPFYFGDEAQVDWIMEKNV